MFPQQYWIGAQATADGPGFWSVNSSVSIDNASTSGVDADLYAVILDKQWSDYFALSSAEGNFDATALPPTVKGGVIGPITVTRISGSGTCH